MLNRSTTLAMSTCVLKALLCKLNIKIYQSPLILTELFQHNLINVSYLMACYLNQVMMTLHFLNDVAYDDEWTQIRKLRRNL